jgi:hypothetical protein
MIDAKHFNILNEYGGWGFFLWFTCMYVYLEGHAPSLRKYQWISLLMLEGHLESLI